MVVAIARPKHFLAAVQDGHLQALGSSRRVPLHGEAAQGTIVAAWVDDHGVGHIDEVLAEDGSARAVLYRIAAAEGVEPFYPDAVLAETSAALEAPGLDDAALEDLEGLPFVTVDGAGARDLDQALHVAIEHDTYVVRYAIADAAHFAPPGSALFAESLERGASYYLPGLAIPMLPRPLSEGIVSLNPGVVRRALVFEMHVARGGVCDHSRLVRARIRSRHKLAFEDVQALWDAPEEGPLAKDECAPSLHLLRDVGRARLAEAAERDVPRHRRDEAELGIKDRRFVVMSSVRSEVELANEQLSLLCNSEGARLLAHSSAPHLQPIYRVHPSPERNRLERLRDAIAKLVILRGLDPARFAWKGPGTDQSLAAWLAALPESGDEGRVARAIQRQAILVNVGAGYSPEPGRHHGVGVEPYARFSAPMREVVGVFLHREAIQLLDGGARTDEEDEALRTRVIEAANGARARQRRITSAVHAEVLESLLEPELALEVDARTVFRGTVVGVTHAKVHVQIDAPALDLKMYVPPLSQALNTPLTCDSLEVALIAPEHRDQVLLALGDPIALRVVERDARRKRWVLLPPSPEGMLRNA